MIQLENPKEYTNTHRKRQMDKFSRVTGYMIIYRNQLYFYIISTNPKIKKITPFIIALKIIKYLGINSIKEVKVKTPK